MNVSLHTLSLVQDERNQDSNPLLLWDVDRDTEVGDPRIHA